MNLYRGVNTKISILLISVLSILFIGCEQDASGQYTYRPPEYTNDGLDVGSLDEVNIDALMLGKAVNKIRQGKFKEVHSMLIFRNGKLVFEEYFEGHKYQWDGPNHHGDLVTWDKSMSHVCHSVTKSITSACIGIALEKGFIDSVHQSIFDYLPEHQHFNTDGKDTITIEHLLTMTSGLKWDEWSASLGSASNDIVGIWFSDRDPVSFIVERPLVSEPGTSYTYSGGNSIILGEIVKYATDMNIDEFSGKYLFDPLGIDSYDWWNRFENGVIETGGGLKMTPRDMLKIGVTFLNDGVWNGEQIISEQWVGKSATTFPGIEGINIPGTDKRNVGYTYSWWTKTFSDSGRKVDMYEAGGWGGQVIAVFPGLHTVVVFTGGTYTSKVRVFGILEEYVVPAIN